MSDDSLIEELSTKNEQLLVIKEKLEAALNQSHRTQTLLDATIQSTASGVVVCDLDVNFVLINPAGRRLLGRISEVGPEHWNESLGLFQSEEGRLFREEELPLTRACGGHAINRMELFVRNGTDFGPLWVEANATQILGLDNQPLGAVTVFNDITMERQSREGLRDLQLQTESKLADSNRALEEVLTTIPEAIWRGVKTENGFSFTYFSPGIERIIGHPPDRLINNSEFCDTHVHPLDRIAILERLTKIALGESKDSEVEYRLIHQDGSTRWIRVHMRAVVGRAPHMVQGIMSDITRERDTRIKLDRAERLVSLGTLAAGIAHEINNPLQAMMMTVDTGQLHLAHGALSNEQTNKLLDDISQQISRCSKIVSGVLQFTGDTSTKRDLISLDKIVDDSIKLIRFKSLERKIEIKHRSSGEIEPLANANSIEIGQVVVNLLANAIDASADGATIETVVSVDKDRVIVSVIDKGKGMDAETQRCAFDPFYTTKRRTGGTGLGLSLSHTIMEHHNGEIWIESSSVDQGTTISLWLTRVQPEQLS